MALAWTLLLGGCATEQIVTENKQLVFPDTPGDDPRFYYERTIRSSADILPEDERNELGLQALVTGTTQAAGKAFGKPYGVSVFQGRILVSDTLHRSLLVFDPTQAKFSEYGKESQSSLRKPMGLKQDKLGNIYVVDATSKNVAVFDKDGKFLRNVGEKELFDRPSSLAVNPEGTRLFVVDTGSSQGKNEFHRIVVFDPRDGKHLFNIGKRGTGDGEFNLLRDAVVSPKDGLLYVVDGGNFRIQVFDQNGNFKSKFGSVGRNIGQFARPKGIAVDKEGFLYVSDSSHSNFQIFDPDGNLMLFIGTRGPNEPAKYLLPGQITVDEDGRVYLVDQGYSKLEVFRPAAIKEDEGALGLAFKKLNTPEGEEGKPKKKKEGKPAVQDAAPPASAPAEKAPAPDPKGDPADEDEEE